MCGCSDHQHHAKHSGKEAVSGVRFKVADMTCGHCAGTIRKALEQTMPGAAVAISLETNEVTVAGDAATAERAIRAAGYEPQLLAQ